MIKIFYSVLPNTVATSYMWWLNPWNVASATEEMNCYSHSILITSDLNLNRHVWLVAIKVDSREVDFFFLIYPWGNRGTEWLAMQFVQGQRASQWQNHGLNLDSLTLEHELLTLTFPWDILSNYPRTLSITSKYCLNDWVKYLGSSLHSWGQLTK